MNIAQDRNITCTVISSRNEDKAWGGKQKEQPSIDVSLNLESKFAHTLPY